MGKKKDELKRAREEAERTADEQRDVAMVLQERIEHLQRENGQLSEALALVPSIRLTTDVPDPTTRQKIATAMGIVLHAGDVLTDDMILQAVDRMQRPQDDDIPTKRGETLADAIAHNKGERSDLLDRLTRANLVITRIAAALLVEKWDEDGVELVEKSQRFGVLVHMLRKRLAEAAAASNVAVVDELRTIIAILVAPRDLSKYLSTGRVPVTANVLDLAQQSQVTPAEDAPWLKPLTMGDVRALAGVGVASDAPRALQLLTLFDALVRSASASTEFLGLMNNVILPMLARVHAASTHPVVH